MLMDIPVEERLEFLERITHGAAPAYRITQKGDPRRMERIKMMQPKIYTEHRLTDRMRERLAA